MPQSQAIKFQVQGCESIANNESHSAESDSDAVAVPHTTIEDLDDGQLTESPTRNLGSSEDFLSFVDGLDSDEGMLEETQDKNISAEVKITHIRGALLRQYKLISFFHVHAHIDNRSTGSSDDDDDDPDSISAKSPRSSTPSNGSNVGAKETPQSSRSGIRKTKRRRSPSRAPPRTLGSKENPIDVDNVASLFEPIVIRDYVWAFIFPNSSG